MTELTDITFRGVAAPPHWPSRQTLIHGIENTTPWTMDQAVAYNARADEKNVKNTLPTSSYSPVGFRQSAKAIALALRGQPWEATMNSGLGYQLFGDQLYFFWHHQFRILFPEHPRPLRMMNWETMTETMAMVFVLGRKEEGVYQGELAHAALRRTYDLREVYEGQRQNRGYVFMLRLFSAWRGNVSDAWPLYAFGEPIYEGILERWNAPDPAILVPWLIAACDRHTHEAQPGTEERVYDFSGRPRIPLEILLLFRLRELAGLANPVLDHPLMETPFDRLPAVQPPYVPDELMQGTLKRVREDWPEFDRVVTLEAIRVAEK